MVKYLSRGHDIFWANWGNIVDSVIVGILLTLLFVETVFSPERDLE